MKMESKQPKSTDVYSIAADSLYKDYYTDNHIVHLDEVTSNCDENVNENSQMLIKNEETIVKMNAEFKDEDKKLDKNEAKQQNKQEVISELKDKKLKCNQLNHSDHSSSKFNHEHHHHSNRTMDLVFRNLFVSIPTNSSSKQTISQEKQCLNRNWLKRLCFKYALNNQKSLIKEQSLVEQKDQLNKQPNEHQTKRDILSDVCGYSKPGQLLGKRNCCFF